MTDSDKPKRDFVAEIINFLAQCNRLIRSVESVLIDLIASTAPWLAPLLPAYMAYHGLTYVLKMPQPVSIVGSVVVEFLGLSAVSTTLTLWDYNDQRRQRVFISPSTRKKTRGGKRKTRRVRGLAPVWIALSAGVFYLIVVLTVNVLLDTANPVARIAKGLLSSLSVIAALILATRAQHARRLEIAEQRREEIRAARDATRKATAPVAAKPGETITQPEPVSPRLTGSRAKVYEVARGNPEATHEEIGKQVNISRQMAGRYIKELQSAGLLGRNGTSKN